MQRLWEMYDADKRRTANEGRKLKRTTFTSILSKITTADTKQRACVDYKLHALVYENASTLKRIIEDNVEVQTIRKELVKKLEAGIDFLKYSYITHLEQCSTDPYHDVKFALNHGSFPTKYRR